MKLIFVRHCDPDYAANSLTEKGWQEAEILSRRLAASPAEEYYVSPMGRARDTASLTMQKLGREPVVLDWLREFQGRIIPVHEPQRQSSCWNWLPQNWVADERFFSEEAWPDNEVLQQGHVREEYEYVIPCFDAFLASHGYERDGKLYRVTKPNTDTVVFFCHFGIECLLLSRLLNVPPMPLWQGMWAAPGSLTTVVTEERQQGTAIFRVLSFGDYSHLTAAGMEPSSAARFCEVYGGHKGTDPESKEYPSSNG